MAKHESVLEPVLDPLRRAPPGALRAYWALRSRVAEGLAAFHSRAIARRIARALHGQSRVCFAQVGSNDGVRGDPLRPLVLAHPGWTGVFAEPVPELFAQLVRNYPADPRLQFERVAVGKAPGRCRVFTVSREAERALGGLPSWYDQVGSMDPEHVVRLLTERVRPFLVAHDVERIPLAELLARAGLPRIDLLHVDAEGADHEIVGQLDLGRDEPVVVLFEHAHLSPGQRREASEWLRAAGYRLSRHGGDTLAVRAAEGAVARH
jgi:FkbM family methyltransferase